MRWRIDELPQVLRGISEQDLVPGAVGSDPAERDIGLRAAQLLQCCLGNDDPADHAGGGGQHPIRADEIDAPPLDLLLRP